MSAVAYGSYFLLTNYFVGEKHLWVRLVEAFVPMAFAGIAFLVAAKLLRIEQLEQLIGTVRKKLAR